VDDTSLFDYSCCALDEGHEGACESQCSECEGTGRCPACDGDGGIELCSPCELCDGSSSCPGGCYEGRQIEEMPWIPQRAVETVAPAGGVL
jgi:hypothetical protein